MKPSNGSDELLRSGKPKASLTPFVWALVLIVTGPIWIVTRALGWFFTTGDRALHWLQIKVLNLKARAVRGSRGLL